MKTNIGGTCVCMLVSVSMLLTVFSSAVPHQVVDTTKDALYAPINDAAFDMKISFLMKLAGFPSLSACVITDDRIIWSKGYGYYLSLIHI